MTHEQETQLRNAVRESRTASAALHRLWKVDEDLAIANGTVEELTFTREDGSEGKTRSWPSVHVDRLASERVIGTVQEMMDALYDAFPETEASA